MQEIWLFIEQVLGLGEETLTVVHMTLRACIVYVSALLMVRIGEKRFLGKNTAFDVILGIIFGSVVSRAITGSSEFLPTLAAGLVVVLLHWLFAALSFYFDWFGSFVKGHHRVLVEDGEIQWDAMRRSHISEKDLMSSLRSQGNIASIDKIKEARLERSGEISVVKRDSQPRVIDIQVDDGVQMVRIQID